MALLDVHQADLKELTGLNIPSRGLSSDGLAEATTAMAARSASNIDDLTGTNVASTFLASTVAAGGDAGVVGGVGNLGGAGGGGALGAVATLLQEGNLDAQQLQSLAHLAGTARCITVKRDMSMAVCLLFNVLVNAV